MLIDCEECELRNIACSDCVITALAGMPSKRPEIGPEEARALRVLAEAKLISPLRMQARRPLQQAS
jgi:hypothetical protein